MLSRRRQQGFTIVELMVSLVVGLLVMGGVLTVYLSTLRSSHITLNASRLNQEMGAILNIMVNDIRRAGYWGDIDITAPQSNPFGTVDAVTAVNTSAVRVHSTADNGATYLDKSEEAVLANRSGSCLVYTYDVNSDGVLDPEEKFGFRWDGQAGDGLMMRISGASGPNTCITNADNTWHSLSETATIEITALEFSLEDSTCVNTAEPDGLDRVTTDGTIDEYAEANCNLYAPVAGERTVESLRVLITLSARLADAPEVEATMAQTVQVRNYLVRLR
jgi:type IV pilus assembly protein PilW